MRIRVPTLLSRTGILLAGMFMLPIQAQSDWGSETWGVLVWSEAVSPPGVPGLGLLGLAVLAAGLAALAAWSLRKRRPGLGLTLMLVLLAIPLVVAAGSVTVPHTFVNGTTADATQVNANFDAVVGAVNDNDARITTVVGTANAAQVRVSGSCAVGSSIRAIADDGTVTCEVDDNTEITPDSIGALEIAPNSVGNSELDNAATFVIGGLTVNGTGHLQGTPIIGMWYPTSSDGSLTSTGDGGWNWDAQLYNTNPSVFAWNAGADSITIGGAAYPGYYEICWKLMYGNVADGSYVRTLLEISGTIIHDTLQGATSYTYQMDAACAIRQFNSNETVKLEADSNDPTYIRYGQLGPRYSWMTIKKLN